MIASQLKRGQLFMIAKHHIPNIIWKRTKYDRKQGQVWGIPITYPDNVRYTKGQDYWISDHSVVFPVGEGEAIFHAL